MKKTIIAASFALAFSANVLAAQSCKYDLNNNYAQYMGSCTDDNGCYPYNTVTLEGLQYALNADDHWTAYPLYLNGKTYTRGAYVEGDGYRYVYQICGDFGPDFSRYGYENSTSACPGTQPNGAIFIQRRYEVWSDGSVRNYTGWYETSRSCSAIYRSTESQSQSLSCGSYGGAYTEGGNGISQRRSREIWSDGARAWSGWQTTQNTCYRNVSDEKDRRASACAEGQKGHITTILRRNHIEYASDTAKSQAEKNALNEQNATSWTTVVTENTCSNVPDRTWTEAGNKVLSCAEVKGNSYTGSIIQSGTYTYSYSSTTKKTTSTFTPNSQNESCSSSGLTFADVTTETKTEACDAGQSGIKTYYRNVATDSSGKKTYPNGDAWGLLSNTCIKNEASSDTAQIQTATDEPKDLISNMSVTSSSLMKNTDSTKYLASLKSKSWKTDQTHNLEIVVDDLAGYKYSATKVSDLATGFVDAVGASKANVFISLPYSANQMIGVGEITSSNAKQTIIKSVNLSDGVATVKYRISTGTGNDKDKVATVNVLTGKAKALNVIIQ